MTDQAPVQKHGVPALMSFFVPGLGQLVKGQVSHALTVWLAFFVEFFGGGIIMASGDYGPFFGVCTWMLIPVTYLWQVADAYNRN